MVQLKIVYLFLLTLLLIIVSTGASAQLITDSDARLKTFKRDRVSFSEKQQKKKQLGTSSATMQSDQKKVTPRYSQPIAISGGVKRRYKSQDSGSRYVAKGGGSQAIRSASGSPYLATRNKREPGYSPPPPFRAKDKKVDPRFSSPASIGKYRVNPVRYSPGSPFSTKDYLVKPRYSPAPNAGKIYNVNPVRYSPGSPFSTKDYIVKPRYSPAPNAGRIYAVNPIRYSPGSPFSTKDYVVKPRYSPVPNAGKVYPVNPIRYSPGTPFTARDKKVNPRYSQGPSLGEVIVLRSQPRYSPGSPFTARDKKVNPRYSSGSLYGGVIYLKESPRYSSGTAFDYYKVTRPLSTNEPEYNPNDYKVKPRYSITNDYSLKRYWMLKHVPYGSIMYYKGPYTAKIDRPKNGHPSSAHLRVQYSSSGFVEDTMRSWSIATGRVSHGNNSQPAAVTDKVSKPKFDRKEREIWHN